MKCITRAHVHVDRVACPWLIDAEADRLESNPYAPGLEAIAQGYSLRHPDDFENVEAQFEVYDALYAFIKLQAAKK